MAQELFHNWNTTKLLAGFTTSCAGLFRYANPEDEAHYAEVAAELGLDIGRMIRVNQKHTDFVRAVGAANGGEGVTRPGIDAPGSADVEAPILNAAPEGCDGLITDERGLVLCAVTADCVPVFLWDEAKGAIGMVHSGRVGTWKEIAVNAVRKMQEEYASKPEDIRCILGPSLCAAHHEVGRADCEPFAEHFTPEEQARFIRYKGEKGYIDMAAAIRISLTRTGMREENIHDCGVCTYERGDLYSWRRDRDPEKRILSFIVLK